METFENATFENATFSPFENFTIPSFENATTEETFENETRIPIHILTRFPPGLFTSFSFTRMFKRAKNSAEQENQKSNVLPWVIAGILGTLVIALMTLILAQQYFHKKAKQPKPLSELSPLLAQDRGEQIY